jgi:hypothetical protein
MMRRTGKALANADITFLAADASVGAMVVSALADRDIASVATFAPDMQERRREKMASTWATLA